MVVSMSTRGLTVKILRFSISQLEDIKVVGAVVPGAIWLVRMRVLQQC